MARAAGRRPRGDPPPGRAAKGAGVARGSDAGHACVPGHPGSGDRAGPLAAIGPRTGSQADGEDVNPRRPGRHRPRDGRRWICSAWRWSGERQTWRGRSLARSFRRSAKSHRRVTCQRSNGQPAGRQVGPSKNDRSPLGEPPHPLPLSTISSPLQIHLRRVPPLPRRPENASPARCGGRSGFGRCCGPVGGGLGLLAAQNRDGAGGP